MSLCPHLGLPADPTTALRYPSTGNRCHGNRLPRSLTVQQQEAYCLTPAYASCPLNQPEVIQSARELQSHLLGEASSRIQSGAQSRVLSGAQSRVLGGAKGHALTILLPLGAVIGALLWWIITA
jgi:hypothetical protein